MNDYHRNLDQTGQHYMIDKALIRFIVDEARLEKNDVVLEIGYGKGALTRELAKKCKVIAVDIEKSELDFSSQNLKKVHGNILEIIDDLKFNKIVSNIPYNISEPLMKRLFKKNFDLCILTCGKNFADTMISSDNRIGIIASHLYDIELLKDVNPKAFYPAPRIWSAVIRIEPKVLDDADKLDMFYKGLAVLDHRKLKNAFEELFPSKRAAREFIELNKLGAVASKKLYQLTNEEFVRMDDALRKSL